MVLGALLLTAAITLLIWNIREDRQAGISAEKMLTQVMGQIAEDNQVCFAPYDTGMKEVEIDGYACIGYLSVPSLELKLPVMSEWDYTRLRIAPCRYMGSAKSGDLVIAAHNYTQHFGHIKDLSIGDPIYFTDMEGTAYTYTIGCIETLNPTGVDLMVKSKWDLTLFTCTYGGRQRVTVRCQREYAYEQN